MSEHKVDDFIAQMFQELNTETVSLINRSSSADNAYKDIVLYIAGTINAKSLGFISSLYSSLSEKTLQEPFFVNPDHANSFYDLQLDNKMLEKYKFDITALSDSEKSIDFEKVNKVYTSAAIGAGTAAVSGILLSILTGVIDIPVIVIIAGALVLGLIGNVVASKYIVPEINKKNLIEATHKYLVKLESEMHLWVSGISEFYNNEVESLKRNSEV